jgi:hypothetical protein
MGPDPRGDNCGVTTSVADGPKQNGDMVVAFALGDRTVEGKVGEGARFQITISSVNSRTRVGAMKIGVLRLMQFKNIMFACHMLLPAAALIRGELRGSVVGDPVKLKFNKVKATTNEEGSTSKDVTINGLHAHKSFTRGARHIDIENLTHLIITITKQNVLKVARNDTTMLVGPSKLTKERLLHDKTRTLMRINTVVTKKKRWQSRLNQCESSSVVDPSCMWVSPRPTKSDLFKRISMERRLLLNCAIQSRRKPLML